MKTKLSRMRWACACCGRPWPDVNLICRTPECGGQRDYNRERVIEPMRRRMADEFDVLAQPSAYNPTPEQLEEDLKDLYPGGE